MKIQHELFIGARRESQKFGPLARLNDHFVVQEADSVGLMLAKVGGEALRGMTDLISASQNGRRCVQEQYDSARTNQV